MVDFSKLPRGQKFQFSGKEAITRKLQDVTRHGESGIIHDKAESLARVLHKYSNYIKSGGLSRLQRAAAANQMRQQGNLTSIQYEVAKKLLLHFSKGGGERISGSGSKKKSEKIELEKRKLRAKISGIRARNDDCEDRIEERNFASEAIRSKVKCGLVDDLTKNRVSALSDSGSETLKFAKDRVALRRQIRDKYKSGDGFAAKEFDQIGTSALSFGGAKAEAGRLGIKRSATGYAGRRNQTKGGLVDKRAPGGARSVGL
jgi:hypothetical protein